MSANPTSPAGTQAPGQIELLWDRYRSLAYVVVLAILGALGVNYALKYLEGRKTDTTWSSFAANLGLSAAYTDQLKAMEGLSESLANVEVEKLRAALDAATPDQKPFVLHALARRAVLDRDWAAAEGHLAALEQGFPNHSLVRRTPHPVQVQEVVPPPPGQAPTPARPTKEDLEPAQEGSVVAAMRAQIEQAKAFQLPSSFSKPEIPTGATKVKFDLSGDFGSFTIALMPDAPRHGEAFKKLAETKFWEGLAVDEIRRPVKNIKQPRELHVGFESTKADDRDQWKVTDPSSHIVEFEKNGLLHFAGAVSARNEADGKSCADRFWVAVDDAWQHDGERVVFGFVVEGLENLKRVCEAAMPTAQDEERGIGRTLDAIRVTAVTVLP